MAILKSRPVVRVRVPNELRAGGVFEAEVLLECKRPVDIDFAKVEVVGAEVWRIGSGDGSIVRQTTHLRLAAQISEARTLPVGVTRLPVRIALPEASPASFRGSRGTIEYEVAVHVAVPWWADRRSRFEIRVVPDLASSPETVPGVYSPRPEGARETEPHVELSLASTWTRVGGIVSGAFALANVQHHRYSEVTAGLVGTEVLYDPRTRQERRFEYMRYQIRLGAEHAREGEMIPFRFRLPDDAMSTFARVPRPADATGLLGLEWVFELRVGIRWRMDLKLQVPFDVLPRSERPGDAPARIAPPIVGSGRLQELWTQVGRAHGMTYEAQMLWKQRGDTQLLVRRDHMGRGGVHLAAELRYPPLHLALEAEPYRGVSRMVGGGMKVGFPEWDREHHVIARDEGQAAEVLGALIPAMGDARLRRMDDESLIVTTPDRGESPKRLDAFLAVADALHQSVERLRQHLPPPPAMRDGLPSWRALARQLGGELETARMRVRGQSGPLPIEVRLAFDEEGQPAETWFSVESPSPLDDRLRFHWIASEATAAPEERFSGDVLELVQGLIDGAQELEVEADRLSLGVGSLLGVDDALDRARADRLIGRLTRLLNALRGHAGPYR